MALKKFFTVSPDVLRDCCDSMHERRKVSLLVATIGGEMKVKGDVRKIERIATDHFEITVEE